MGRFDDNFGKNTGLVGVALMAFAVGGFVVWCLMHFGGAR